MGKPTVIEVFKAFHDGIDKLDDSAIPDINVGNIKLLLGIAECYARNCDHLFEFHQEMSKLRAVADAARELMSAFDNDYDYDILTPGGKVRAALAALEGEI